ncbi:MAG: phosphatase [Ignavibacteriae bacterium HGW-Ignavibacteriae-3]|nr:MAG: phosphatase [Ignavibacteriae bacterium HGW-Ignavibacteriae-3]
MGNFEGIIFDIDGTLTSTNELIFATFRHVTEKYLGKEVTDEEIISLFGPTEDVILKEFMNDKYADARKDYMDFYEAKHHIMADVYPGIIDVVKFIKSKKIPLSIYTGKGRDSSIITLTKIGIIDLFDMIVTGDDVEVHKPSPEGINVFVQKFNLNRDKVLMIGDAPADVIAARGAGVKIASVVWDSYAKQRVLDMKSDYVFETVDELMFFLESELK